MEEEEITTGIRNFCGLRRHRRKTELQKMTRKELEKYADGLQLDCKEKDLTIIEKQEEIENLEQRLACIKEKVETHINVTGSHCQLQCGKGSVIANTDPCEQLLDKMVEIAKHELASLQQKFAISEKCLKNVETKVDVLTLNVKDLEEKSKPLKKYPELSVDITKKLEDIKLLLRDVNRVQENNEKDLEDIAEEGIASIRNRDCFADSITAKSLPKAAKPLHRWTFIRYAHRPRHLQRCLCDTTDSKQLYYKQNETLDENICALWLVKWVKDSDRNTAEELVYRFKQLDEHIIKDAGFGDLS